ncbi:hypothetical protein HYALB_00002675 [Hymenoscyphus albidus]|uniref:Large ribosomal subunit protein mL49 n=1 Tax=Hymenoscyphus albidus TaxID=595503 RepID=A0A9N9LY55_9HELO|nr:hypothetical protein HYALB_00002675 [Hymenoscyphus albidus]
MSFPFLRPSALPRPSTILQFLRHSTSLISRKPYQVLLSPSNQLPVYQHTKRGGNKLETKIKNIMGDIQQLRADLRKLLAVEDEKEVQIKAVVEGQIIVKGHKRVEINQFFEKNNIGIKQKPDTI